MVVCLVRMQALQDELQDGHTSGSYGHTCVYECMAWLVEESSRVFTQLRKLHATGGTHIHTHTHIPMLYFVQCSERTIGGLR